MIYCDPHLLDKLPDPRPSPDPDIDWIVITGIRPHSPSSPERLKLGEPCPTCGFRLSEDIVRRRAVLDDYGRTLAPSRRGRVVCSDDCRASLDGLSAYWGLPVGSAMNPDWREEESEKPTVTVYQPKGLAGGRGMKERVKGRGKR